MLKLNNKNIVLMALSLGFLTNCAQKKEFRGNSPAICSDKSDFIPTDFLFVVDNSRSNEDNDPYRKRATSIESVYEDLKEIDGDNALAVVSFPSKKTASDGADVELALTDISTLDKNTVEQSLEFTKNPAGWTPYGDGLTTASTLLKGDRQKVVVMLTDGLATDLNPKESLKKIKEKYENIPVYILLLVPQEGGKSNEEIYENMKRDHRESLSTTNYFDREYSDTVIEANINMIDKISANKDFVTSIDDLGEKLTALVFDKIDCKN